MFTRVSRSAYICLQCRTGLPQPSRTDCLLSERRTSWPRRWQSNAAAAVEEEDDYDDVEHSHPPARQKEPKRPRNYRSKRWRAPGVVAQLGVPALGKPAEVLVLEPRDRKIPEMPEDRDEEHSNGIQESLDSEGRPLSPDELKVNIEHIRDELGNTPAEMDAVRWQKLKSKLLLGFTTKQLASYVEQRDGTGHAVRDLSRAKYQKKQVLVKYILRQIWALPRPEGLAVKVDAVFPKHALRVLLQQKDDAIKTIADKHGVQIEIFEAAKKATLTGPPERVHMARRELLALNARVLKARIDLSTLPGMSALPASHTGYMRFLESLRQKYGVSTFTRSKKQLVVYYHEDRKADIAAVKRLLLLAGQTSRAPASFKVWRSSLTEPVVLVPYFPRNDHDLFGVNKHWTRLRQFSRPVKASRPTVTSDEPKMLALGSKYTAFLRHDSPTSQHFTGSHLLRTERSVQLGQVLFEGNEALVRAMASGDYQQPAKLPQLAWTIATDIPFLPHYLSSQPPWTAESMSTTTPQPPFVLQLRLRDTSDKSSRPAFEILLTGQDGKLGRHQPLQMISIVAVLEDRTSVLLTPGQVADLCFRKRVLLDVFRAGAPSHSTHAELLEQLRTYLHDPHGQAKGTFDSFVKFKWPKSLAQLDMSKRGLPVLSHPRKTGKHSEGDVVEYVLESADVLDVASYRVPSSSNLCLEHTIVSGNQSSAHSQTLKLVETPLLAPQSKRATQVPGFFHAAYEIAASLDNSVSRRA